MTEGTFDRGQVSAWPPHLFKVVIGAAILGMALLKVGVF